MADDPLGDFIKANETKWNAIPVGGTTNFSAVPNIDIEGGQSGFVSFGLGSRALVTNGVVRSIGQDLAGDYGGAKPLDVTYNISKAAILVDGTPIAYECRPDTSQPGLVGVFPASGTFAGFGPFFSAPAGNESISAYCGPGGVSTNSALPAAPADNSIQANPSAEVSLSRSLGLSTLLGANATTRALYTPIHSEGAYGVARRVPGYQAHHLNQNAIYKNFGIPESAGFSINIRGNALNEAGSAHYEAHASLEQWWNQYRRGGDRFGEVPTNSEVGEASRQSLVDAGLDPTEAQRVSEIARQQRINAGHAEAAPVPRIPGRVVQTPTSTVDETLWKTRRVATGLKWGGRALMAYGAAMDAASLYSEFQKSQQTGNYGNTANEAVRIAGGWGGAWAVGATGAEVGAQVGLAFGPVGALVGGFAGGVAGGALGYWMGSYASQGIYADMRRW